MTKYCKVALPASVEDSQERMTSLFIAEGRIKIERASAKFRQNRQNLPRIEHTFPATMDTPVASQKRSDSVHLTAEARQPTVGVRVGSISPPGVLRSPPTK